MIVCCRDQIAKKIGFDRDSVLDLLDRLVELSSIKPQSVRYDRGQRLTFALRKREQDWLDTNALL